jgi:hypothetical protein
MHALTGQLAAVMASTDAIPRLVRQFSALFLVTPQGDVWRIFDSEGPETETRSTPTNDPHIWARIFIGSGATPVVRVYRFRDGESRSVNAERLFEQLGSANIEG